MTILKDQFNALEQPLRDTVNHLISFAQEALPTIQQFAEPVYGTFHGGDPRNFTPDPECSTDVERENHRKACELWTQWETEGRKELPESHSDCSKILVVTRYGG